MDKKYRIFLPVIVALLTVLVLLVGISTFSGAGVQIDEPVARGGTLYATRAYTTSTMTVSSSVITISNASFGWSATDISNAEIAYISAHTAGIVVTWDGNDPTTTKGMPVTANTTVSIKGTDNVGRLRFIRAGGGDATVSIALEK